MQHKIGWFPTMSILSRSPLPFLLRSGHRTLPLLRLLGCWIPDWFSHYRDHMEYACKFSSVWILVFGVSCNFAGGSDSVSCMILSLNNYICQAPVFLVGAVDYCYFRVVSECRCYIGFWGFSEWESWILEQFCRGGGYLGMLSCWFYFGQTDGFYPHGEAICRWTKDRFVVCFSKFWNCLWSSSLRGLFLILKWSIWRLHRGLLFSGSWVGVCWRWPI